MGREIIDDLNFHDNLIHKIEFVDENFETDLILDIDYITEWISENDQCKFRISPAHVSFKNVSNMIIKIEKPGFPQFSYLGVILGVEKEFIENERYLYSINLTGGNTIVFEASEFSVTIVGKEYVKFEQYLTKQEREEIWVK